MALDFLNTYFCAPLLNYEGYNIVNTLVYGAILLIVAFKVVYPYFKKQRITFDAPFLAALVPFILLGSTLRIFEDLKFFPRSCNPLDAGFYTISPGIYIAIGLFTILVLAICIEIGKRFKQEPLQLFGAIGTLAFLAAFAILAPHIRQWPLLALVLFATIVLVGLTTLATRYYKPTQKLLHHNPQNQLVLFGQLLDGMATFTAIQFFGFSEQHVVSNFIIQNIGTWAFPLVKLVLMLLILHYTDKEIEDPVLRNFIKAFILIIGLAPGFRDLLLMSVAA
ncbi:MAG: DUF63 family protein [Candidatus Diapherotrites archaeon]|nr:DUF63 family protein [Candidatus Diapherotrites archaeon]